MATVALSGIITPTNVVTATSTTTLTNKTLTGAVMNGTLGATTPSTGAFTTVGATGGTAGPAGAYTAIFKNSDNGNSGSIQLGGTSFGALIYRDSVGANSELIFVNSHAANKGFKFFTGSTIQGTTQLAAIGATGCIAVGTATPSTDGAGITFPASQSASTDANTLDDYEEGTWTPTFTGSYNITSGNAGLGIGGAKYTKIGRSVTAIAWITGTVTTGATATGFRFTLPINTTGGGYFESGSAYGGSGVNGTVSGDSNTESNVGWGTDITSGAKNFCVTLTYFSA